MQSQEVYLLGGRDLEMLEIGRLLEMRGCQYCDRQLGWGAKASDYTDQIAEALHNRQTPVLIELAADLPAETAERCIWIDHHDARAGKDQPSSLEQIAQQLGIPAAEFWANRWWQLVTANDKGHVRALQALRPPATDAEIRRVRSADLQAQGVTEADFDVARTAAGRCQSRADGQLTVVRTADDRLGLVAEVMEPFFGGPGFQNLLIYGASEVGFFGAGLLIGRLVAASPPAPASWSGGMLPESGFWGAAIDSLDFDPLTSLEGWLSG